MVTFILLHIFHVIIRLLIPNTVVVHLLYTASEITSIYTEVLVQYHSKSTDTVCSIKLKREEFLYIRTIFDFQAECVFIYMLFFYQISAWVFLIHMYLYAGFYCTTPALPSILDAQCHVGSSKPSLTYTPICQLHIFQKCLNQGKGISK